MIHTQLELVLFWPERKLSSHLRQRQQGSEEETHTIMCPPYDSLAYQKLKTEVHSINIRKLCLWDFKGTYYLKYLRKYVSKSMTFTYLLRVLKGMQKVLERFLILMLKGHFF